MHVIDLHHDIKSFANTCILKKIACRRINKDTFEKSNLNWGLEYDAPRENSGKANEIKNGLTFCVYVSPLVFTYLESLSEFRCLYLSLYCYSKSKES